MVSDDMRCRIEPSDHEPFKNAGARQTHEKMKHNLVVTDASQLPLEGAESVVHAQELGGKVDKLTEAVGTLVEKLTPVTPAAATVEGTPTLAQVIAHCEGGSCTVHSKELEDFKAGIIRQAWANIPDDVLRDRATATGLIPTSIVFERTPVKT